MKLLILMLFCLIVTAQASDFQGHGISFQVPDGWHIAENDSSTQDAKVVLSDNYSTIRVDVIKGVDIEKLIKDFLNSHLESEIPGGIGAKSWREIYSQVPWFSNDAMVLYYLEHVLGEPGTNHGSGISIEPDGAKYVGVSVDMVGTVPMGWTVAWTKPTYDDELIGVHGAFNREYVGKKIVWPGSHQDYYMPKAMYNMLMTVRVETRPLEEAQAAERPKGDGSIVDRV
jgi:hypothetical protein